MPEDALWSQRRGGSLPLSAEGFATLLVAALRAICDEGCMAEVLGNPRTGDSKKYDTDTAGAFFSMALGDPWPARGIRNRTVLQFRGEDDVFDLLEVLYRDVVSLPDDPSSFAPVYDKTAGQARMRTLLNPILKRRDAPLELSVSGQIVELGPEPFRRLVEQSLPDHAPRREVTDRVADAVGHFRRRNATTGDRRAAVKELADVLEFLRDDVKVHMLTKDERDLFHIANEFALRHNKPTTRRDFDEPVWLAWTFYVYLATIRLTLELKGRD